jgi:hypothetical protein
MLNKIWPFLKTEENQNLLGGIGAGLVPSVPGLVPPILDGVCGNR